MTSFEEQEIFSISDFVQCRFFLCTTPTEGVSEVRSGKFGPECIYNREGWNPSSPHTWKHRARARVRWCYSKERSSNGRILLAECVFIHGLCPLQIKFTVFTKSSFWFSSYWWVQINPAAVGSSKTAHVIWLICWNLVNAVTVTKSIIVLLGS